MLKCIYLSILISVLIPAATSAQNLQLHFDPRHAFHPVDFQRNILTATFEMLKPDKWGSTFMFVDIDFSQSKGNIGLMYTEISRDQNIGNLPFKAHLEFNGGYASWGQIPNAYLLGLSLPAKIDKLYINTFVAYKYHTFAKASNDIQWTLVWSTNICKNKFTISGFFDIWTENKDRSKQEWVKGKKSVILSEPQFWYNIDEHLALGSEVEISSNFYKSSKGDDVSFINPTLGVKWSF